MDSKSFIENYKQGVRRNVAEKLVYNVIINGRHLNDYIDRAEYFSVREVLEIIKAKGFNYWRTVSNAFKGKIRPSDWVQLIIHDSQFAYEFQHWDRLSKEEWFNLRVHYPGFEILQNNISDINSELIDQALVLGQLY